MDKIFWESGLDFSCTRCSACCRHEPGFVFLSLDDLYRLVRASGLTFRSFIDTFTRSVDIGTGYMLSLREKSNNDCILWGEKGCVMYASRPLQCSTYPFWQSIMESEQSWRDEASSCPGIGKKPAVQPENIMECLVSMRKHPALVIAYDQPWENLHEDSILGGTRFSSYSLDAGEA